MRVLKAFFLLTVLFHFAEASSTSGEYRLIYENRLLKSEYQLARTSQIYFLFDLVQKRVQVKHRGFILKEFSIDAFHLWGKPAQPIPYHLAKKKAPLEPKRPRITSGRIKEDSIPDSYFLGVDQMPSRYRLILKEGFNIYVRPKSDGILSTFFNGCSSIKSFFLRPLSSLWGKLNQKPFGVLDIYLSEKELKSLYWSLQEGQACIIYNGIS